MIVEWLRQFATADLRTLTAFRLAFCAYLLTHLVLEGGVPADGRLNLAWAITLTPALILVLTVIQYALLLLVFLGYRTRWSSAALLLVFGALNFSLFELEPVVLLLLVALPVSRFVSLDDAMDRGAQGDGAVSGSPESMTLLAVAALRALAVLYLLRLGLYVTVLPAETVGWMSYSALFILVVAMLPLRVNTIRFVLLLAGCLSLMSAGVVQAFTGGSPLVAWLGASLAVSLLPASGYTILSEHGWLAKRHGLRIYYDQPCGFCRKICYIFASFMLLGRCQIAAAQTHDQAHKLLKENDSWVVFGEAENKGGNPELCWAAVLLLMRHSPVWAPLGWLLTAIGMGRWGKPLYRLIGASRGVLSALTSRLLPYVSYPTSTPVPLAVIAGLFATIVAFHLCISISHYVTGPLAAWLAL